MDTKPKPKPDDASALAWILAIEALRAPIKWIPLLYLAPEEIWDRFGENATERSKGVTGSVSPNPDSKGGFDPSESCVNVLRQILLKYSGSSKESAKLEMMKWDVESFIQHKKSCLPKSFLEQEVVHRFTSNRSDRTASADDDFGIWR